MPHTPGPWEAYLFNDKPGIDSPWGSLVLWGGEDEEEGIHGLDKETRYANARLIAAAPDLLAEAEAFVDAEWMPEHARARLRAAIAKARGP